MCTADIFCIMGIITAIGKVACNIFHKWPAYNNLRYMVTTTVICVEILNTKELLTSCTTNKYRLARNTVFSCMYFVYSPRRVFPQSGDR